MLLGTLKVYALHAVAGWSGDLLVAGWDGLEKSHQTCRQIEVPGSTRHHSSGRCAFHVLTDHSDEKDTSLDLLAIDNVRKKILQVGDSDAQIRLLRPSTAGGDSNADETLPKETSIC